MPIISWQKDSALCGLPETQVDRPGTVLHVACDCARTKEKLDNFSQEIHWSAQKWLTYILLTTVVQNKSHITAPPGGG